MAFVDVIEQAATRPQERPFAFEVGQRVRVRRRDSTMHDGQTPKFWPGSVCKVVGRRYTVFLQVHSYQLRHDNGATDDFEECELDARFRRRAKP